jgi:hypothetical protein
MTLLLNVFSTPHLLRCCTYNLCGQYYHQSIAEFRGKQNAGLHQEGRALSPNKPC